MTLVRYGNLVVNRIPHKQLWKSKRDPWAIYDGLPAAIRAELQEGPIFWSPLATDRFYRRQTKDCTDTMSPCGAPWGLAGTYNAVVISLAEPWQPDDKRRRTPVPSPHILAQATIPADQR